MCLFFYFHTHDFAPFGLMNIDAARASIGGNSFSSLRDESGRFVVRVHDHLAVAICSVEQGKDLLQWRIHNAHYVTGANSSSAEASTKASDCDTFQPLGLRIIHGFCEDLWHSHAYKQERTVVVCAGIDPKDVTDTALLVGSFMILNLDLDVDNVIKAFEPISHRFIAYSDQLAVSNCWSALHHAYTRCGWLDLESRHFLSPYSKRRGVDALDIHEYMHYDCPLNGGFHAVVPDKLFVFDCPADLPDGAKWADTGRSRRFGAAYYADVFGDFGVDVVVRCCDTAEGGGYDVDAFAARGIEVEDLALDDGAIPILADIDRFLTITRHAPGAVAVHGGLSGLGAAGLLVAAHLISCHGFRSEAAIAWLRMIHPSALPAVHGAFLVANEAAVSRRRRLSNSFSHSFNELARSMLVGSEDSASPTSPAGKEGPGDCWGMALKRSVSTPRMLDLVAAD